MLIFFLKLIVGWLIFRSFWGLLCVIAAMSLRSRLNNDVPLKLFMVGIALEWVMFRFVADTCREAKNKIVAAIKSIRQSP